MTPCKPANMDPRIGNVHLNSDALDSGGAVRPGVDRLLALIEHGQISVVIPHSVVNEIGHPKTPHWVKAISNASIVTFPVSRTPPENARLEQIKTLLRGNALSAKHDADAEHLFEASKYGGRYFVTYDARILSKSKEINAIIGPIRIVTLDGLLADYDSATAKSV